jgi:hypothetical protein
MRILGDDLLVGGEATGASGDQLHVNFRFQDVGSSCLRNFTRFMLLGENPGLH